MIAGDGRLRVDGTAHDHDHAVCQGCGTVYDVERGPPSHGLAGSGTPPPGLPEGTPVLGARIEYDVLCADCARGIERPTHDETHP